MALHARGNPRDLARKLLFATFGELPTALVEELETSVVRQWATYEGVAVVVTMENTFWYRRTSLPDGRTQIVRDVLATTLAQDLSPYRVSEDELPGLCHDLTLLQRARCKSRDGEILEVRVDPFSRTFPVELVPDDDWE